MFTRSLLDEVSGTIIITLVKGQIKVISFKNTRKIIHNKNVAETINCAFMCEKNIENTVSYFFVAILGFANLKVKLTKNSLTRQIRIQ